MIISDGHAAQVQRRYEAHPCGVADLAAVVDPDHQLATLIDDLGAASLGDADPGFSLDRGAGCRGGCGDRLQPAIAGGGLDTDTVGRPVTGGAKAAAVIFHSPFGYGIEVRDDEVIAGVCRGTVIIGDDDVIDGAKASVGDDAFEAEGEAGLGLVEVTAGTDLGDLDLAQFEVVQHEVLQCGREGAGGAGLGHEAAEATVTAADDLAKVDPTLEEALEGEGTLSTALGSVIAPQAADTVRQGAGGHGDVTRVGQGTGEVGTALAGTDDVVGTRTLQLESQIGGGTLSRLRVVVGRLAAGRIPGHHGQVGNRVVCLREVHEHQGIPRGVLAAELAVGQGGDLLFEEPEPHEGVAYIGDPVGAEVEQQVVIFVVCGGIGVGQVILVGHRTIAPAPFIDIQYVFIPPAKDAPWGGVLDDAGELGGPSGVGWGIPVITHDCTCVDVVLRVGIQLER
ncbi:hypothetical protein D3C86_1064240 [compost metagenome]